MLKAVIFDFFDVIRSDGFNRWLAKRGLRLEGEYLEAAQKNDRGEFQEGEFIAEIAQLAGEPPESVADEMENGNELNRELVAYIASLHGRYKTAILSNSDSEYLRNEIEKYELKRLFDEIIISSEVGYIKPQRGIFDLATTRLGVKPDEVLFTDDNPRHIEGAKQAGLHTLLFTSTSTFRKDFEQLVDSRL